MTNRKTVKSDTPSRIAPCATDNDMGRPEPNGCRRAGCALHHGEPPARTGTAGVLDVRNGFCTCKHGQSWAGAAADDCPVHVNVPPPRRPKVGDLVRARRMPLEKAYKGGPYRTGTAEVLDMRNGLVLLDMPVGKWCELEGAIVLDLPRTRKPR